jgi:hypothetical protein
MGASRRELVWHILGHAAIAYVTTRPAAQVSARSQRFRGIFASDLTLWRLLKLKGPPRCEIRGMPGNLASLIEKKPNYNQTHWHTKQPSPDVFHSATLLKAMLHGSIQSAY